MISKYRSFLRNIDSLADKAQKLFFRQKSIFISVISKYRHFPRNIDSLADRGKKRFLGKNQFLSQ